MRFVGAFLLSFSTMLFGLNFDHLTVDDGLSSNHVFCIHQDSIGFMWFGTNKGLNRWDGLEFKIFRHDSLDSCSISSDDVRCFYQDRQNKLWIGTTFGLNQFDPETERCKRFFFLGDGSDWIDGILSDADSVFWLASHYGVIKFYPKSGAFERFLYHESKADTLRRFSIINSIHRYDNDSVILGTWNGFGKFNTKSCQFVHFHAYFDTTYRSLGYPAYKDREGKIWFGFTSNWPVILNPQDSSIQVLDRTHPIHINYSLVLSYLEDDSGKLWIATLGGGLNCYDRTNGSMRYFLPQLHNPFSISSKMTCSLYLDRQGNLWIGTYDGGVNKIARWRKQITLLHGGLEKADFLGDGEIMDLCEDKSGYLWVASLGGGFARVDPLFETVENLYVQKGDFFNDKWPKAIFRDARDNIWFGDKRAKKFDWHEQTFSLIEGFPVDEKSAIRDDVQCICQDKLGNMWYGQVQTGLRRFDKNLVLTAFFHDPADSTSLCSDKINKLCCDFTGDLWIGTAAGLSRLSPGDFHFKNYYPSLTDSGAIKGRGTILALFEDSKNRLWIGTGVGLSLYDRERDCFENWTPKLGASELAVIGIQEDKNGALWLRTPENLYRIDQEFNNIKVYGREDGFIGLDTVHWGLDAFHAGESGYIYYGGSRIVGRFSPDELYENPTPPPLAFTTLKVNYSIVAPGSVDFLPKSLSYTDALELPFHANTFSIDFAVLDYTLPHKNQAAYMLEGLYEKWINCGTDRTATFTDLSPGRYLFRVKGSNNDGVWNESGIALSIKILPPWWRTVPMYCAYFCFTLVLVLLIWRSQVRRLNIRHELQMRKMEAEKLQELDHLKSQFFANISHEFRTPLTLILGPVEQFLAKTKSLKFKEQFSIVMRNARYLQKLINELLDFARLEAGTMTLKTQETDIVLFTKRIVASFMSLAERKKISLRFESAEPVISCFIDPGKVEKILTNLLSNAFKFTADGGRISVVVQKRAERIVEICVHDTGIGIHENQQDKIFDRFYQVEGNRGRPGTGIGLAFVKELVELHRGSIEVQSQLGTGSTFIVRLPLGRTHLKDQEIIREPISETIFEAPEIDTSPPVEEPQTISHKKPLVLIVEDNEDVQSYLRDFLGPHYFLKQADDGITGFQVAVDKIPDLIISDVMMPNMDGFELCQRLKSDERTSHIPVILLTARASEQSKLNGLELGADDYIAKPFSAKEVIIRIRNLIEQRKKLRERYSKIITLEPKDMAITSADERFLQRALGVLEEYYSDADFTAELFGRKIGLSRMQLHRKLYALTGQTTSEFIKAFRLKKAARLLKAKSGTIGEICYSVGFRNPSHFSSCFREAYGLLPSEYYGRDI